MPAGLQRQAQASGMPRRSVLALALVGGVSLLSACRLRLEDDAPRIPLVPTRTPLPDEAALQTALRDTRRLQQLAAAFGTGTPSRLAPLHAQQAAALARMLGASAATQSLGPALRVSRRGLGEAEQAGALSAVQVLPSVTPAHLPLLLSLAAQRAVAAEALGASLTWGPPAGLDRASAARLLATERATAYGFDVVAGQGDRAHASAAAAARSTLGRRLIALQGMAEDAAGPPPLGYRLPYRVDNPGAATRLARHLLLASSQDLAATSASLTGNAPGLATLLQWLAEDEALAARWGMPAAAFPGLRIS